MDYKSKEFQRNRKSHKKKFTVVLEEFLQSWRSRSSKKSIHETITIKHEYIQFLQHIDFRRQLKQWYPDLVACLGQKYGQIELTGTTSEVVDATVIINEQARRIREKHLTIAQSNLVWNIVAKNRWNEYFTRKLGNQNIKALVCDGQSHSLVVLALSQEECERAFQILFEIIREDTLSVKSCSVQNDEFQSLIAKLQRGTLIKIDVLPNLEENAIRIIGVDEEIAQTTKQIYDFVEDLAVPSYAFRPRSTRHVWNFLARRVNQKNVLQIAKDLELYSVSIQVTDDNEHFYIRGHIEGVEQCKQLLTQLAAKVVQEEKKFEYPGVKRLFHGQAGVEHLQMIRKEMDVEIEVAKAPRPLPRNLSLPTKRLENYAYDLCKFTTNEGVNVSWKYGAIENEEADVLVYSARSNLNNPTACGRGLSVRGGMSFQEAYRPHTNIEPGEIVITESGALPCKYVIHAVCRNLHDFEEPLSAHEFLQSLITKILNKCYELRVSSLAIPLIGANRHGFPEDVVLKVIRNTVNQLSSSKGAQLTIKNISVIVSQSKPDRRQSVPLPSTSRYTTPFTPVEKEQNTQGSATKITFGQVHVSLSAKSKAEYQADALINLSLTDLIVPNTKNEPMNPPPGSVRVTNASGSGRVRHCIHCVPVSLDSSGLERAAKACLYAAKVFVLNSIVISTSGISSLGISANEYAKAIFNIFQTFSKEGFMMNIDVIVCDKDIMQIFIKALEEKEKNCGALESQRGDHISSPKEHTTIEEDAFDKILTIGSKEKVTLRLVGFSDNVKMCTEKIEAYVNQFKTRKLITEEKIVEGFWKHNSKVKKRLKDYEVFITLTNKEVCIEGMAEQVFECKDMLIELLNNCDKEERESKKLREIMKSVQWSYSDVNGTILFDEVLKEKVESEIAAGNKQIVIQCGKNAYEVDVDKMTILEFSTGLTACLRREHTENIADVPEFWEPQPKEKDFHMVSLSPSSNEYQKIIDLFGPANDLVVIQKIERIQNLRLYRMYASKKKSMGTEANEMQLFHGTKSENVASISTNNFNRGFSGINGTRYGCGVYFAKDASYSIRFSKKDNKKGSTSLMYVAKVLVGICVEGKKKMRVLPKRNDLRNPELFYDSAVDNVDDPSIFVTFDDYQCYPEYLITFQSK